jgi:prephenate dehydrogenase
MKKYQIGIIGYGDFTKVMLEYLEPYADIIVSSRKWGEGEAGFGAKFAPLKKVLSQPIIVPSFPSQYFGEFFASNQRSINPQALVIDVCSVKVKPLQILEELLPKTCSIIGTHPAFGPASIKKNGGISGLKCAFCPVRASESTVHELKQFLRSDLKLNLIELTPDEHDIQMAYAQGLCHYIARVMDLMDIPKLELSTLAYDDLYDMKMVQAKDSWDLFQSIMGENLYAKDINKQFKNAQVKLDKKIRSSLKS